MRTSSTLRPRLRRTALSPRRGFASTICDTGHAKPRDECAVFGVADHPEASVLTALGLHALQHRGQEGCGIASFRKDDARFFHERHKGLVGDSFNGQTGDLGQRLPGLAAVGHARYSTAGGQELRNLQPLYADVATGGIAIAHNGNLTNAVTLRQVLVADGAIFQSTSDTEVVLQLIARAKGADTIERFLNALQHLEGAYAFVALTDQGIIGARDPLGIRPLVLGKLDGAWILASETCALDIIGAEFVRDIENGELVVIRDGKVRSRRFVAEPKAARPCLFEYVYFARPDSVMFGRPVYDVRRRMGQILAEADRQAWPDIRPDVVVPVPDSGVPAALGYAEQSGIPFQYGIIRNHYVGRTFIQPKAPSRHIGVRMKLSANKSQIAGRSVLLVDDSIVRGTTSTRIVNMLREAGAREVHFRSASPPIAWPDYYGIDMPTRAELIAATHTHEQMTERLGADSLGFLSIEGLYRALGETSRNEVTPQFTDHYFTGQYPIKPRDATIDNDLPDAPRRVRKVSGLD